MLLTSLCSIQAQNNQDCDTLMIFSGSFDVFFQNEFNKIQSDTIVAIRHCNSTNGCSRPWGLLCWKENDKYKMRVYRRNFFTNAKGIPSIKVRKHLIKFFTDKIYLITGEIKGKNGVHFDDGPATGMLFKTTLSCWRFGYVMAADNMDPRQTWLSNLKKMMK